MRVVAVLAGASLLAACGVWYRPVPVRSAIGKERVLLGTDSVAVHRDPRFEAYGPTSLAVFDAYEQLNRTYRAFDRYLAAPAPRLAVILRPDTRDSVQPDVERALLARRLHPLRYVRPMRAQLQERSGSEGYEGSFWPVGPTAARLLLASMAAPGGPTTPIDTSALSRFPAWFRSAVVTVVSAASSLPYDVADAKEQRGSRLSMERLLATERPTDFDYALDPNRRDEATDADRRFASLSSAFAQFLLDREGQDVLGRLARGFADGRTFEQVASGFTTLPRSIPDIDVRWQAWLAAQRPGWDQRP